MRETLTAPQMRALRAVADLTAPRPTDSPHRTRRATARQVAKALWPDSPAWERRTSWVNGTGRNGAMGGTMPMKAATVLWRIEARGLVENDPDWGWSLTDRGRGVLAGTDVPLPAPAPVRREVHVGGSPKRKVRDA